MLVFEEMFSFLGVILQEILSFMYYKICGWHKCVRRSGLMVSALVSRSNGPGCGHCVVFLSETLNPHSASLHADV